MRGLSHALTNGDDAEPKDVKENGVISRSATPIPSRTVTPKPPDVSESNLRQGLLTIRIFSGASL